MLKLLRKPEDNFLLACSGGVDSMAAADFFRRGGKKFSLAYFHHNTSQADKMMNFVSGWGSKNNVEVLVGRLTTERVKGSSPEEFWRNERYKWLTSFGRQIVTCHHLNDVAETWIFSGLNGNPKLIKSENGLVIRPFLLNTKSQLIEWCQEHNVDWVEDTSNTDVSVPRNRIRHNILPECLKVNPGLMKVLKKKYLNDIGN